MSGPASLVPMRGQDRAYYLTHAPSGTTLEALVKIAGMRWTIDSGFEQPKDKVGCDQDEVRRFGAWHRQSRWRCWRMLTSPCSGASCGGKSRPPLWQRLLPLIVAEVRRLEVAFVVGRRATRAAKVVWSRCKEGTSNASSSAIGGRNECVKNPAVILARLGRQSEVAAIPLHVAGECPTSVPKTQRRDIDSQESRLYSMERVMGIEPTSSAWEAEVLPLNYTRRASSCPLRRPRGLRPCSYAPTRFVQAGRSKDSVTYAPIAKPGAIVGREESRS
jgi:hypothetical protein